MSNIIVLTHNPKGKWGDVRSQIEQGSYEDWGKGGMSFQLGQQVLIYISKGTNQIKYIMEVYNIHDNSIDLKLIRKLDESESQLLSFENLKLNGLKVGTVNYVLNNNKSLYEYVMKVLNSNLDKEVINESGNIKTKNIILYGSPGVGKTHNYQKIITLIENEYSEKEIFDSIVKNEKIELDNEDFTKIKDEKRVEFVTFHQSYSYEDFIEGFRPNENSNIELEDGIFKLLCNKAKNQSKETKFQHISFDEAFDILRTKYIENELEKIYSVSNVEILIHEFKEKTIKVQSSQAKDHQYVKKSDLETVVTGILKEKVEKPRDIKNLDVKKDTMSLGGLYFPIGKKIIEIIKETKKPVEESEKNFYIVIDEINRGNISKIFGELITLIEESKRDNYEVTLPYSKEKFKVPSNLYIIATMNSTDKSIATIDIALRRRFTFIEMKPNSNLIKNQDAKQLMEKLNSYTQKELGEDYMLGHSYFMEDDVDLEFIKEYKIKPLLEEYFYSDDKTVDEILQEALQLGT